MSQYIAGQSTSLTDDLAGGRGSGCPSPNISIGSGGSFAANSAQRSMLAIKCGYLLDEDSSPDSERMTSLGDVDSGHSTAHSPTDLKSMSPTPSTQQQHHHQQQSKIILTADADAAGAVADSNATGSIDGDADCSDLCTTPFQPPAFGGIPYSQIEMLEPTHRGLHKFVPRHRDEIEVEIGDSVYVQKEADDLWCEGVNLRTGRQGIFPSAYAVDLDYNDFDPTAPKVKRERYLLGYLGSVETLAHKGTGVVCQAVRKIVGEFGESPAGQLCILEISDQGLRMVDRSNKQVSHGLLLERLHINYSILHIFSHAHKEKRAKETVHRLFLLVEERIVLRVPPARSSLHWLHHQASDHTAICVSRLQGSRIDAPRCRSGRVCKYTNKLGIKPKFHNANIDMMPISLRQCRRAFQHFYQKFIETAYPIEDIYIE